MPLLMVGVILFVVFCLLYIIPIQSDGIPPSHFAAADGQFLTFQGIQIYIETSGNPDHPAVLLVHGMFGSTWVWRKVLDLIAAAGFYVIAFDRPAFGLSDKPLNFDYSYPNQAALIAALLDSLKIERTVIVGHSAGGAVVLDFVQRYPHRVAKLVIVDAAILMTSGSPAFVAQVIAFGPVGRLIRVLMRVFLGSKQRFYRLFKSFYSDPALYLTEADFVGHWRALQTPGWDAGLLGLIRDMDGSPTSPDILRRLEFPTLILWGEADTLTPIKQGRELAELIPQAKLVTFPGAGHQIMEEQPAAFSTALVNFLQPG